MLRAGLANMALGVAVAVVGALITGLSYALINGGGGTYVVAYGAIVVGTWRFLVGFFQVLRGALIKLEPDAPVASRALPIVGVILIAEAILRVVSLSIILWGFSVGSVLYNLIFNYATVTLPAALVLGDIVIGALLVRRRPIGVSYGIELCAAGLLFQGYDLATLLESSPVQAPWLAESAVHLTVYIVCLILLVRSSRKHKVAAASSVGQIDAGATNTLP